MSQSSGPMRYSIGSPTDAEQLYVELINRARADADAEALRLAETADPRILGAYATFAVDLDLFIQGMAAQPSPTPPLAINPILTDMARLHSLDQLNNLFQGHTSSADPPEPFVPAGDLASRARAIGYSYQRLAENVFAYAESVPYGHAGFVVDWGNGPGGMQDPPGHRNIIHSPDYREIGVGVLLNQDPSVAIGPQVVTQNFGAAWSPRPMITGVTYFDLDGDNFYDVGEGLGDVEVTVEGSDYYAVSAHSGGYAVPLPGNGVYEVTFRTSGMLDEVHTVTVSNGENRKVDLALVYQAPEILGTGSPMVGAEHTYRLSEVPGISNYQMETLEVVEGTMAEGAEPPERSVTITSQGGYDVIQSMVSYAGFWAFHLAHPTTEHKAETIQLDGRFFLSDDATLQFASRLGAAGDAQVALVEISTDEGESWHAVYEQAGSGFPGETPFALRTVDLGAFAGAVARIRFVYELRKGSYYPDIDPYVGWLIDEILLTGVQQVISSELIDLGTEPSFTYAPAETGGIIWRARAQNSTRSYPFGPRLDVSAVEALGAHCYGDPVNILGVDYPSGKHELRSAGRIATRGQVVVADGAELLYESSGTISLGPGFSVKRGGAFTARIAPVSCQQDAAD